MCFFTNEKRPIFWIWVWLSLQCARVRDEAPVCGGRMVRFLFIDYIDLLMMIDDGDDHDDWWWWSLWPRWLLTTFFFHRKTASWPPSPGGFWPTMFFSLVIFAQPSLFVSFFPVDISLGGFFPHCLKMVSSQFISLFAPHRNWGYQKSFHTGTIWSSPGLLSLPELTKSWGADYTEIANDEQDDQSGCNVAVTIANDGQDGHDNADYDVVR